MQAFSGYESTSVNSPTYFSGAHHANYDGYKADSADPAAYNVNPLANSYRFIARLRGYGNMTDRWQNVDKDSHNEYLGGYFSDFARDFDYTNAPQPQGCTAAISTDKPVNRPG